MGFYTQQVPCKFSLTRFRGFFIVYGGSTVEPLPMFYSSSPSDHEEIPLLFQLHIGKKWLVSYYDTNHFSVQQLS